LRDPQILRPEEWLDEYNAANGEVLVPVRRCASQAHNALADSLEGGCTVLHAESVPGKAHGELGVVLEEATTGYRVDRASQLEEQWFATSQYAELTAP